jgi:uncharacterized protein DUF3971
MAALRKLEASLQDGLREQERIPRAHSVHHAPIRGGAPHDMPARDLSIIRKTRDASLRDGRDPAARAAQMRDAPVQGGRGRDAATRSAPLKASGPSARTVLGSYYWRAHVLHWWMRLRKLAYVAGGISAFALFAMVMLWWRLSNGPIELDVATPWLTAAIEENFGPNHRVEVGGTQIERDANGHTALRIRDIVVRDHDGEIVASAPKAEVGVSGSGLMTGHVRAQRLSLVGAEMQVRIEPDSKVTVFAGTNKQTFVTASASSTPLTARASVTHPLLTAERTGSVSSAAPSAPTARNVIPDFAAILAWIDSLSATGLDGKDLGEIGLKNGNLTVDDQRNGRQWTFENINLSLTRPKAGSVALTISSDNPERPWSLRATLAPGENGHRVVNVETKRLPAKDLMLALRVGDGTFEPDLPVSAKIRADIGPDGMPRMVEGRILMERGHIVDIDEPLSKMTIDRAEFSLDWDATRHALIVPFQIVAGGNRMTLFAQLDAPREPGGSWNMKITGGTVVLAAANDPNPIVLNRFLLRMRLDPEKQRIDIEQGELGNMEIGLLVNGQIDLANGDPRLDIGIAGSRMSVAAMKQLWPPFMAPKVRNWVEEHIVGGTVERISIATNANFNTLRSSGPPIPENGLGIEITGNGAEIRPIEGLPTIRDADMSVRISGRTATVNVGRGTIELAPNRKLAITNGVFEVPDTHGQAPPAKVRFRIDGPVPAAAELLNSERLREFSGAPVEPGSSRGTLSAQIAVGLPLQPDLPPGSAQYTINMDVANFAAERMVMGQKVEATNLRVTANNDGYQIRGDVKINGVPAALEYRRPRGDADAEVRVRATLDEAARARLGFDLSGLNGPVPIKIEGRVPSVEGEGRFAVEADLTQARVDKLVPGWFKPAGRQARAAFTAITKPNLTRLDDFTIESNGTQVKGTVEINDAGDIVSAQLPVFQLADGDKATLKAERGPDGALRVMMRGDVLDGRGFIRQMIAGPSADQPKPDQSKQANKQQKPTDLDANKQKASDLDLDVRLGTVAGFHGETVRGLDVRMSRRGGTIKSFTLSGKIGRDTALNGDLRGRSGGRNVLFVESADAGAFFRLTDTYPKIYGGEMWVAMDPPGADPQAEQDGILNIRDFSVRGEAALERVAAGSNAPNGQGGAANRPGVEFSRMRVEFTRSHGRFTIREGLVKGPVIGATTDGYIDYLNNEVHMRGTIVPFYGLNNMFGQIPIFGQILGGGSNEGLVGLTYEVAGPPSAPVLRVNPISVVAPGLFRKFFEFPTGAATRSQSYADPAR